MKYIVIEIQVGDTVRSFINDYDTLAEAQSKYYSILSAAALSQVPKHSALLINDVGEVIANNHFIHSTDNINS